MLAENELPLLADKLKPYIVPWLPKSSTSGIGGGGGSLSTHDIGGSYHSGTLRSDQAPQFALLDGSRVFTGNIVFSGSQTVDGVDLSVHVADANAHHAQATIGVNSGLTLSGQLFNMGTPGGLSATSSNAVSGASHTHAIDSTIARSAITLSVSGLGFSGGGDLTANRTFSLASSSNPGAAASILATSAGGTLTLNNSGSTATAALVIGNGSTGRLAIGSSGWVDNGTQLSLLGTRTLYVGGSVVGGTSWNVTGSEATFMAGVDSTHTFGQARLSSPIAGSMMLSHVDSATTTGYAFRQTSPGATIVNAASGQTIYTRIANADIYTTTATGINISSSSNIGTDNYASQATGWRVDYAGGGDFRYLFADEMHVKSFIADLEQALAGGQIICKSVAVLAVDFTAPAAGGTATLRVRDLPSAANMATFQSGDVVRLRNFSRASGSLSVSDCWGVATTYTDQTDGTQTWTFTRSTAPNAGAMTAGTVVKADSLVLDYGVSGNGFYEVNAIDGAYGVNSPYAQIARWTGHPATGTVINGRFGKLSGLSIGVANEMGIAVGSGFTASDAYFKASNVNVLQNNVDSTWKIGGVDNVKIDSSTGMNIKASEASTYPNAIANGVSWWVSTLGSGTQVAQVGASKDGVYGHNLWLSAYTDGTFGGVVKITGTGTVGTISEFQVAGSSPGFGGNIYGKVLSTGYILFRVGSHEFNYDANGLKVGHTSAASDGTATIPYFNFTNDTNTGIYRPAADQIGIATGGTQRVLIGNSSITLGEQIIKTGVAGQYETLRLGGGGSGIANANFITFYDQSGTTRQGYVGLGSTFNYNVSLASDLGDTVVSAGLGSVTVGANGTTSIAQSSATAAVPTLLLTQPDLSEEFIEFSGTVAAGNPIDTAALGSYYGKVRVSVNGTFKWLALYN